MRLRMKHILVLLVLFAGANRLLPSLAPAQIPPAGSRSAGSANRPELDNCARAVIGQSEKGRIDVYFEGDSITRRWGATDYPDLLANWTQNFFGWNAANFGWGADAIQNILWRLHNGELDGVHPKVIVLLAAPIMSAMRFPRQRRGKNSGNHQGLQCDAGDYASESSRNRHHFNGHFPPQRQYGGDALDK